MKYFTLIVCPPLLVLAMGKPTQAAINVFLSLFFYLPGLLHAYLMLQEQQDNLRTEKLIKAIRDSHTNPQPESPNPKS